MEKNEFILYLYKITDMGVKSTKTLLDILKNKENKILPILDDELDEYNKAYQEVKELMKKRGIEEPNFGILQNLGVSASMHLELMQDNSDTRIANMLIQGYTMGNLELEKQYKKYKKELSEEENKIVDYIKEIQDENIKKLKTYL
jgi:predicted RND superfamily exporter protein